jgi:vitamin B12 transporter
MKKSIRIRARALARFSAPALSVLSLAVAASVQAQGIEINPVVVSATRMEQPLSEVLSSVSVITRQDIDKSQAASFADLLQGEAGFEFGRNGGPGTTTSFFMRGQESKNVVVLIDGVRSQTDGGGSLTITDVPLSQIERVEVLRGNAGALYGEAAIGGVINVITRAGKGTPKAYGAATVGSRKTTDLSAGYGGSVEDTRFDFNAGTSGTAGFSAINADKNLSANPDRDAYRNQYAAGKVDQKIDATLRVGVRASTKNSVVDYDNGYGTRTEANQFKIKTDSVGAYVNKRLTDNWMTNFDASSSNFSYDDLKNGVEASSGYYTGHQDVFRWSNNYALHSSTNLNFGLDQSNEKFLQRSTYDAKRDTAGYFAGVTSKLDRWNFQANARRDTLTVDNSKSAGAVKKDYADNTHLLGLGYQLTPEWRLTSTASTGFRAPAANDLVGTYGNPDLMPETHRSQELGAVYSVEKALLRVVYFETRTQNTIAYDGNYKPQNTGETRNKGYEITARAEVLGNSVKSALVLQDPWNVTSNQLQGRRAKQYGSFDISRLISGYEVGTKFVGSSDRSNFGGQADLAGYTTWAFYASRQIDNDWTARVKLENAFNRNYELAGGYNTPGRGIFATLQYQPK